MVLRLLALPLALASAAVLAAPAPAPTAVPAIKLLDPNAAPAPASDGPVLSGRIANERYFAASGIFSVGLPKLHAESKEISDTDSLAIFRDRVSVFVMIGAWPMSTYHKWELETSTPREFLVRFFGESVLIAAKQDCPLASLEETTASFRPNFEGGAFQAQLLLPGGSAFPPEVAPAGAAPRPPAVAKRGVLVFLKSDHIFAVSVELAERVTKQSKYNLTVEAENKILLDRLSQIASTIEVFPGKKPAPPAKH